MNKPKSGGASIKKPTNKKIQHPKEKQFRK